MGSSAFDLVWQKIAAMEGAVFGTPQRGLFTYRFHKTYVVVSPGNQSIPRTYFQKVLHRIEEGTLEGSPSVQGQSFILAILTDGRLRGGNP